MLPYRFTSQASLDDAAGIAQALGIACDIVPIEAAVQGLEAALAPVFAGKPRDVDADGAIPLPAFLQAHDINPKLVAVAINGDVIPKSSYATAIVRDGDALEIVRMVGGGA